MITRRRRIRILKASKRRTFVERLEERARRLAEQSSQPSTPDVMLDAMRHDIALTLNQIDNAHGAHARVRKSLFRQELYLDTEIMQREPRPPVYDDPRLPERDRLRDRLRAVEKERRQLMLSEQEQLRPLHDRLLSLTNRLESLTL